MSPQLKLCLEYLRAVEAGTGLSEFLGPDFTVREQPSRLVPDGRTRNRAQTLEAAAGASKVVTAQKYVVRSAMSDGDRVALELEWTATLKVKIGNTEPGQPMTCVIGAFLEVRDGKIHAQRNYDCYPPF